MLSQSSPCPRSTRRCLVDPARDPHLDEAARCGRLSSGAWGKERRGAKELRSLLADEGFELRGPEIVLIAESFDPEVILAAEWLAKFRIPIAAFSDFRRRVQGDTLISIDQTFPLPGVDDLYVLRSARAVEGED